MIRTHKIKRLFKKKFKNSLSPVKETIISAQL